MWGDLLCDCEREYSIVLCGGFTVRLCEKLFYIVVCGIYCGTVITLMHSVVWRDLLGDCVRDYSIVLCGGIY